MTNRTDKISMATANPSLWMGVRGLRKVSRPPLWLLGLVASLVVASWIPLALIFKSNIVHSDKPRYHLFQDMDDQIKVKAQEASSIFADGRANRLPVGGTVARGEMVDDEHFFLGFQTTGGQGEGGTSYYDTYPSQITVDARLLERGEKYFNIYCTPCHGYDGYGFGPIQQMAMLGQEAGRTYDWVQPSNLHDDTRRERPLGHLYNTINNGIRNMGGYGAQINPADRWAVVAYVKSLQLSQHYPPDQLDAQTRDSLTERPSAAQ